MIGNDGGLKFLVDWMFWKTLSKWTFLVAVISGINSWIIFVSRLGQVEKCTALMDLINVEMEGPNSAL